MVVSHLTMNQVGSALLWLQRKVFLLSLYCVIPTSLFLKKKNHNFNIISNRQFVPTIQNFKGTESSLLPDTYSPFQREPNSPVLRYPSRESPSIPKQLSTKSPTPITNGRNPPSPLLPQTGRYIQDFIFLILEVTPYQPMESVLAVLTVV